MDRRRFLACFGGLGALPVLANGAGTVERTVRIRYWLSPGAAGVVDHERLLEYVDAALTPVLASYDISYGGVAPVTVEGGSEVMRSGEWPTRLITGMRPSTGPVPDANLLLTAGPLGPDPPGFARGAFAAAAGAHHLADLPPRDEIDDVVEFSSAMYAIQIFIHELGHTLGLAHDHGTIQQVNDGHVASPMVSGYAWNPSSEQFAFEHSHCGDPYPVPADGDRYLSLRFSDCAASELRSYRWSLRPRRDD